MVAQLDRLLAQSREGHVTASHVTLLGFGFGLPPQIRVLHKLIVERNRRRISPAGTSFWGSRPKPKPSPSKLRADVCRKEPTP